MNFMRLIQIITNINMKKDSRKYLIELNFFKKMKLN